MKGTFKVITAMLLLLAGRGLCLADNSANSGSVAGNDGISMDNSHKANAAVGAPIFIPGSPADKRNPNWHVAILNDSPFAKLDSEISDLKTKNAELTQAFKDISNDRQAILKKLREDLGENARLKDLLTLRRQIEQDKRKVPDIVTLKKALEEAELELLTTENKDEGLKQEVANMHYNLGTVLQAQNKYAEAIKEFKMDLMANPNDADAHYNLALIYDKGINNREEAIDHYNMYLKINPDATDALQVKERLTDLETQQKIWGNPDATGIDEKQNLGRL